MGDAISLLSPRQLVETLADPEGDNFSVSYSRLPLSRERTPEAGDVAQLNEVREGGCQLHTVRDGGRGPCDTQRLWCEVAWD